MELSEIVVPEGLAPKPMVTCVIDGHLDVDDLRELALANSSISGPDGGVDAPAEVDDPSDLSRIKEKHHSVARMLAGGLNQTMVAKLTGYTTSYLSILLNNPAMTELVEMYRIQNGSAVQVISEKLRTVGLQAVEQLQQKLESEGEKPTTQDLIAIAKLGLDRSDHGPSSKQHLVREDHYFDHAELAQRKADALARNATQIVSREEVRARLAPPTTGESSSEDQRDMGSETPELHEDRSE